MAWRSSARSPRSDERGDRPELEGVLDYYDVQYAPGRASQMVRCPIHGDQKSPSMSLNLLSQLWNCHSCGAGGDVWTLIELKEGTNFAGARAFAESTLGFTAGESGGSGSEVRGGTRFGRRTVPGGSRSDGGNRAYRPSWRGR